MKKSNACCYTSIDERLKEYLGLLKARRYKPRSITACRNALKKFFSSLAAKGITRLQDVTPADLDAYRLEMAERKLTASSMYDYLRYVKQFFRHLEENGHIFVDATRDLAMPNPKSGLQPVPTETEVRQLLAQPDLSTAVGIRDRAVMEVAYSTGLRMDELTRLKVYDPDVKHGVIRVMGKGAKERVVPLGKQAVFWLDKYVREVRPKLLRRNPDEHAMWLGVHCGRRLHPEVVRQFVRSYVDRAGIKTRITPHGLRRACASHMLRGGAHPVQIQMLLGHASLETLSQYLRVTVTEMMAMHKRSKPGR